MTLPILGVDLGTHMGWVLGGAVGPMTKGTFECSASTDLGIFAASSDAFWRKMLPLCSAVAVEKPNTENGAYFAIRKNMALLTMLHYWRQYYPNVAVIEEISPTQGKLTLAGRGDAKKPDMIIAAIDFGLEDPTEHEADALGIWKVFVFGKSETKAEREKRERQERKGRIIKP